MFNINMDKEMITAQGMIDVSALLDRLEEAGFIALISASSCSY